MVLEEHKRRVLRGAICEYLDDGLVDDLLTDLESILREEEEDFLRKSLTYTKVRTKFFRET